MLNVNWIWEAGFYKAEVVSLAVVLLLITVVIVLTIVIERSRMRWRLVAVLVPALLIVFLLSLTAFLRELGAPAAGYPVGQSAYLYHVAEMEKGKAVIVVWLRTPLGMRLFRMPYTRELEKELERFQKSPERQARMRLEFDPLGELGVRPSETNSPIVSKSPPGSTALP